MISVLRHPGGWAVVPIHYSMDEDRDAVWANEMSASYPSKADWEREQEINFQSVSGAIAAENFSLIVNTRKQLEYQPMLPIRISCDFNVNPMGWIICQVQNDVLHVIDEIFLKPGSVDKACDEFLKAYGQHENEVIVYGDASGRARSQLNQRSNYDQIEMRFRGRPFTTKVMAPRSNPSFVNSLRSLNNKFKDSEGNPGILIAADSCPNLIADLCEVVLTNEGSEAKSVRDERDPYFFRTHLFDALRYITDWLWPVRKQLKTDPNKKPKKSNRTKRYFGILR